MSTPATTNLLYPMIAQGRKLHALGKKHELNLDQSILLGSHSGFPDEPFYLWPKIVKARGRAMPHDHLEKGLGSYFALEFTRLVVRDGTTELLVQGTEKGVNCTVEAYRLTDYAKSELGITERM